MPIYTAFFFSTSISLSIGLVLVGVDIVTIGRMRTLAIVPSPRKRLLDTWSNRNERNLSANQLVTQYDRSRIPSDQ